ncbi:MAG: aspartate aminotransferase family protein [Desulfatitalea sp.]|nr:aspartate aminotransferase family protein [Desulfatitalea sp.]
MHGTTLQRASRQTRDLVATGYRFYVPNYKPRQMILDYGEGSRLYDLDGNAYIDLGAGIGVNALGHGHAALVKALTDQAGRLWHTSNIYFTAPAVHLARELVEASGFAARVFFCNSGGEANEAAIKLIRKWAAARGKQPHEREIITFKGAFHGRTLATVTATVQPRYQQGFEPLPAGFVHCEAFNDEDALAALMSDNTAAVMLEPIQGEGGVIPAKPGFLKWVRALCDCHGALMVLDEVQCGMGRTGKLWCHMWEEGLKPDILTSAKALGGGFPIGAMLAGPTVAEVLQFGSHGSTFGGNPMACAAARVVLHHVCTPELMDNVRARGAQLHRALEAFKAGHAVFSEVRGRGLMIGAALAPPWHGRAAELMEAAREKGVLILQAGPDVLRFLPPLNITAADLEEGLERLAAAIAQFVANA